MTPKKIISIIEMYEAQFVTAGVPKIRMDQDKYFRDIPADELLAHAHFLCDGAKQCAGSLPKHGKANRHLAAIQMCLGFAGWYTLGELMDHNRPEPAPVAKQQFTPGVTNFREPLGMT